MAREFDPCFLMNGCGYEGKCLDHPQRPPLAARIAEAFGLAVRAWDDASPDEREEFWGWLIGEDSAPPKSRKGKR
jgi:hypothetical protein